MNRSGQLIALTLLMWSILLAACQQTPSVADVTKACQRGNATVSSVEFGEAYTSTQPEKISGVPPDVPIYPVKVTYQLPARSGADRQETVDRNIYRNFMGELVCD